MTYAARAATSPELALYRTPNKKSKLRAAVFQPTTIYTARINQSFSTLDGVLELTYDGGSGTLADVLPDMTLLIGSSAGAHDVGIVRLRNKDATKFYIGETSDVEFVNDQYLTVIDDFGLWARHVLISSGVTYMDGGVVYSDQHTNYDPVPIMGGNRVLKLTGATVSASFNAASSYVLDSTISAYAWSAPGSSSSSGMTTSTPTITWNSVGWKKVYLTLTAANTKTFFGVRYVYIWNDANPPPRAKIGSCREEAEEGGWTFDITLLDDCDLTTIRDRALVILFKEDYYGSTQSNIGPVAGCENIEVTGWIARETINWNPEQGSVHFTAYGAHYWFAQIPSYPDGVELVARPAAAWTEIRGLTVNKGLFHFLHWRTTATRIMDVTLTDDTKYTKEVSSLAQNLWEQLREMSFLQIFARAGVNFLGQLYIQVHPQLVPEASRTWPTVMTITKPDWTGEINLERVIRNEVSQVNLSGVSVNESGRGTPYFALSPGHTYSHYGKPEIQDQLLVASQADANQKAGLYYGWRNNPYPDIPVVFDADLGLIDCFPRQKCAIAISAGDTPRGISFSGSLVPKSVAIVQDEDGYTHREVTFEAETAEALSVNGDVPGSGDVSVPPPPRLPELPEIPILIPGVPTTDPDTEGPIGVLLRDTPGLLFSENFDDSSPDWYTVNAGLGGTSLGGGATPFYQLSNQVHVCPNGAVYVARIPASGLQNAFIARAPYIGGTFTVLYDCGDPALNGGDSTFQIWSCAINPLVPEQFAFIMGPQSGRHFYIGAAGSYTQGALMHSDFRVGFGVNALSYGLGAWLALGHTIFQRVAADGSSVLSTVTGANVTLVGHVRASTTGITYVSYNADLYRGENNLATNTVVTTDDTVLVGALGGGGTVYMDCDPTGNLLMTRALVGGKGKSSDQGATWTALPNLPPGNWVFRYAGNPGTSPTTSRWIAGGAALRYSPDFGTTWLNKEGTLLSVSPIPNISIIRVVQL